MSYHHHSRRSIRIQGPLWQERTAISHAFPSPHTHILANTVAQNESLYSKREVEEAKQAREVSRMLAYSSFKDISEAISSSTLIDCLVTLQSLRMSIDIYGTPDSILKGKTTHPSTSPDKIITITRPTGNDVRLDGHRNKRSSPYFQQTSQPSRSYCTSQQKSDNHQQSFGPTYRQL